MSRQESFQIVRRKPLTLTAGGNAAPPLQLIAWKDNGVMIYGRAPLERSPAALGALHAFSQHYFLLQLASNSVHLT
eukprot:3100018-Amphidinium_carterae.2